MDLPPQVESIPDDWTTDPAEIHFDLVWKHHRSQGQKMVRRFGLSKPRVLMTSKRETGIPQYMIQSGERYYIWNEMDDTVWQIIKPTGLLAILRTMTVRGQRGLKVKIIEPLEVYEYEEHNE
ncbi:hypothetical protein BDV38DRAFT_282977 [Aspergillus pseudotamarii]|uniref:Uncharacterized protein n=1 Tax=Aspergillus pseudotamarii TaxID=132259 RepID=A0A5N6SUH2_ASPPS|nr:uncharacterized protein BDV38DRAFT_282977 [Aspergillus pseudotamarii]KAE8137431.1 hypothetical protein BDV38DRAFT_282977 [Aspergillus pseudotamarii]